MECSSASDWNEKHFFVVFEGIDLVGKSTQVTMLRQFLFDSGYSFAELPNVNGTSPFASYVQDYERNVHGFGGVPRYTANLCKILDRLSRFLEFERARRTNCFTIGDGYTYQQAAYFDALCEELHSDSKWVMHLEAGLEQPDTVFYLKPKDWILGLESLAHRHNWRCPQHFFDKREFQLELLGAYERTRALTAQLHPETKWVEIEVDQTTTAQAIHEEVQKHLVKNYLPFLPPPNKIRCRWGYGCPAGGSADAMQQCVLKLRKTPGLLVALEVNERLFDLLAAELFTEFLPSEELVASRLVREDDPPFDQQWNDYNRTFVSLLHS